MPEISSLLPCVREVIQSSYMWPSQHKIHCSSTTVLEHQHLWHKLLISFDVSYSHETLFFPYLSPSASASTTERWKCFYWTAKISFPGKNEKTVAFVFLNTNTLINAPSNLVVPLGGSYMHSEWAFFIDWKNVKQAAWFFFWRQLQLRIWNGTINASNAQNMSFSQTHFVIIEFFLGRPISSITKRQWPSHDPWLIIVLPLHKQTTACKTQQSIAQD